MLFVDLNVCQPSDSTNFLYYPADILQGLVYCCWSRVNQLKKPVRSAGSFRSTKPYIWPHGQKSIQEIDRAIVEAAKFLYAATKMTKAVSFTPHTSSLSRDHT
jgi:hypothetical protein